MSSDQVVKIVDNRLMLNVEPKRKYPVVRSDNSITLYVNGKPRREPVIISNAEEIKFEIAQHKAGKLFDLEITEDRLRVYLTVNRLPKKHLRPIIIRDPSKIGDFLITTKEDTITGSHKVKPEDIYHRLRELGVKYGVSEAAIEQAIANPEEKVLIAVRGSDPGTGTEDGRVEDRKRREDHQRQSGGRGHGAAGVRERKVIGL